MNSLLLSRLLNVIIATPRVDYKIVYGYSSQENPMHIRNLDPHAIHQNRKPPLKGSQRVFHNNPGATEYGIVPLTPLPFIGIYILLAINREYITKCRVSIISSNYLWDRGIVEGDDRAI
jgi:hypothetical protein